MFPSFFRRLLLSWDSERKSVETKCLLQINVFFVTSQLPPRCILDFHSELNTWKVTSGSFGAPLYPSLQLGTQHYLPILNHGYLENLHVYQTSSLFLNDIYAMSTNTFSTSHSALLIIYQFNFLSLQMYCPTFHSYCSCVHGYLNI